MKIYQIPLGPVHPALKEPVSLNIKLYGEEVIDLSVELGHVHRGIEWLGLRRNFIQITYLAERICGICSASHTFAYCRALESAADLEVPERAQYIRVIIAELERIHSHLLWAGVAAHEIGFDSVLHYIWKVREKIMDLLEYISGNRVNYAMFIPGGIRRNISHKGKEKILETIKLYKSLYLKLEEIFLGDPTIKLRIKDIGILKRKDAEELCSVGPTARGSGIKKDVRQDNPYSAYSDIEIKAIVPNNPKGDVLDRTFVRLKEVPQSIEIIESCIDMLPEGKISYGKPIPLMNKLKKASGEGIGMHEAPRGEVFHYIRIDKDEKPYSWKVKAPTYNNIPTWKPTLLGAQIADIPIIVAAIDPCISCTSRIIEINKGNIDMEILRKLSKEKTRKLKCSI